jgi:hypothetical protein
MNELGDASNMAKAFQNIEIALFIVHGGVKFKKKQDHG